MNSENSKTSDPHRLLLNLLDEINLKKSDKYLALSNLTIYHTWKNIKNCTRTIIFNISASMWNKKFKLPDGSYSVSDIEDYLSTASKYQKIGLFKIKAGYYLELLLLKQ